MTDKRNATVIVSTDIWPDVGKKIQPGLIQYLTNKEERINQMLIGCPCGCGDLRCVDIYQNGEKPPSPSWLWDGNKEKPTLTPSIDFRVAHKSHWHGFLKIGIFKEC